ncbi:MAG: hypothetical protein QXJ53_02155 [Candidatus Bathyarchaeia archaeon]
MGIKVEENTFMNENGPEKGVLHHFTDENELTRILQNFKIIKRRLNERKKKDYLMSRLEILAEKP